VNAGEVWSPEFNSSGSQIVTVCSDNTARIWDASNGKLLHTLEGHNGIVELAEFNAAGTQIITVSRDKNARIWDAQTGKLVYTYPIGGYR